jgi:RecJ-like exonuclease
LRRTGSTAGSALLLTASGWARFVPIRSERYIAREMVGGEHSSAELTVSVKAPCQECGGRGYVETVTAGGRVVRERTKDCLTCSGTGLIPEDMPLSQFRELLASHAR